MKEAFIWLAAVLLAGGICYVLAVWHAESSPVED